MTHYAELYSPEHKMLNNLFPYSHVITTKTAGETTCDISSGGQVACALQRNTVSAQASGQVVTDGADLQHLSATSKSQRHADAAVHVRVTLVIWVHSDPYIYGASVV